MIPKSLYEKWVFHQTSITVKHGCLGFQERMVRNFPLYFMDLEGCHRWTVWHIWLGMAHPAPTIISGKWRYDVLNWRLIWVCVFFWAGWVFSCLILDGYDGEVYCFRLDHCYESALEMWNVHAVWRFIQDSYWMICSEERWAFKGWWAVKKGEFYVSILRYPAVFFFLLGGYAHTAYLKVPWV